ncbi:hypothetical protein OIDMADRAFT_146108 [Oidiodendron maius Zn]|uniref:DUF7730 domain-containing protein n=1 Tax=Oidiodendron maius (strain Zn) TaxID=913774 RepID=A0A0C3CP53_OIDMZ|nr:hypothetical protein OIDMADRAFT_146108 [Oidiodendron maius Zn]
MLTQLLFKLLLKPLLQVLVILLKALLWLARVVSGNQNREGGYCATRRRHMARRSPPPVARIDLSDERNPLTRPPSPRLKATDSPRACFLLDVLPLELRLLIWEGVLGGHYFHLEIQSGILTGQLCVSPTPNTCFYGRGGCRSRLPDKILPLEKNLLLPILLSCKQTYTESIRYLYSANTFTISQPDVIEYLPILLLPQRIDNIRSLTFYCNLPLDNPGSILQQEAKETDPQFTGRAGIWRAIWHNISAMKGLQTLNVKLNVLSFTWQSINKETATQLLLPISEVVRPENFILSLPFPAMDGSPPEGNYAWAGVDGWEGIDPWDDLPCTIRRVLDRSEL